MTVKFIALITVKDPEKIAAYRAVAGDALAKHGGKVIAGLPSPEILEAAQEAPTVTAILEFPAAENARAWRQDTELQDVHAMRNAAGLSTILALPDFQG